MFYLTYLHRELRRRLGRTVLTVLGLAVGVSLVVVVSALSAGLDEASPRSSIRWRRSAPTWSCLVPSTCRSRAPAASSTVVGGLPDAEVDSLIDENQSLFQTDFSKLGAAGSTFERELFLPATQLTFPDTEIAKIAKLDGVDQVAGALTLLAVHQKGKVPEITAEFQTGGKDVSVTQDIPPPSAAEWKAISDCISAERRRPRVPARPLPTTGGGLHDPARNHQAGAEPAADRSRHRALHRGGRGHRSPRARV